MPGTLLLCTWPTTDNSQAFHLCCFAGHRGVPANRHCNFDQRTVTLRSSIAGCKSAVFGCTCLQSPLEYCHVMATEQPSSPYLHLGCLSVAEQLEADSRLYATSTTSPLLVSSQGHPPLSQPANAPLGIIAAAHIIAFDTCFISALAWQQSAIKPKVCAWQSLVNCQDSSNIWCKSLI